MKKHLFFLLALPLLVLFTSCSDSDEPAPPKGGFEVTPIAVDDISWLSHKQVQVLTVSESSGKFFLDETDTFLIRFLPEDLIGGDFDSVVVNVAGNKFNTGQNAITPFLISNNSPGGFPDMDMKVSVSAYRGGEAAALPNGNSIKFKTIETTPVFKNDTVVAGLLLIVLALIFKTSAMPAFAKFYKFVPSLLLCYFIPAALNSFDIISGDYSNLYYVASRFFLPASLILLCLSIDLKGIFKLGPKALIMFLTATLGIMIGGPIAVWLFGMISPEMVGGSGPDEVWRGLSTVAGSWIGGGANQAAMKEIFEPSAVLFSQSLLVDVLVANFWMGFLLYGAGISGKLDKWLKADNSAVETLKSKMQKFQDGVKRVATTTDIMVIVGIGLGGTALAHVIANGIAPAMGDWIDNMAKAEAIETAELIKQGVLTAVEAQNQLNWSKIFSSLSSSFLWLVVFATLIGVLLSFTKARNYEGAGASKIGSIFLYVLVAAIGSHMNIFKVAENPGLFGIGLVWMLVHVLLLLGVAKLIKAPYFFVAVGSQANVGGAASAPVVASAFSPVLAPVGVLLAVFGYALGTFGAYICGLLMQVMSP